MLTYINLLAVLYSLVCLDLHLFTVYVMLLRLQNGRFHVLFRRRQDAPAAAAAVDPNHDADADVQPDVRTVNCCHGYRINVKMF